MNERIVYNREVAICTESFGNKSDPGIVLLAGATVSMLFWDKEFCERLASNGFFVIRYDNRDVGKSQSYAPGSMSYNILDLLDDVMAILVNYGIETAHFVGMSLGGLISQIAALKYPQHVATLTLISTGPWGNPHPDIPEMDQRIIDFHEKAAKVQWTNENEVVDYMLKGAKLMSGRKPFDKNNTEKVIRAEFRRAYNYITMFNHAALQGGEAYYNRLDEIVQPTLIIHGTDDKIWHFKHTETLLQSIKESKLLVLEGTGHELHRLDWTRIIEGINTHVKQKE